MVLANCQEQFSTSVTRTNTGGPSNKDELQRIKEQDQIRESLVNQYSTKLVADSQLMDKLINKAEGATPKIKKTYLVFSSLTQKPESWKQVYTKLILLVASLVICR